MAENKKPGKDGPIEVPAFTFVTMEVKIIGVTSLISNPYHSKMLVDGGFPNEEPDPVEVDENEVLYGPKAKKPKQEKAKRNLQDDFQKAIYHLEGGGYGFPSLAFKHAIVGASRQVTNLDMTLANRIIFVHGTHVSMSNGFSTNCVKINGTPRLRKDVGRNSGITGAPRLCVRAEYIPWSTMLTIEFNAKMISKAGILTLIQYGGKCEGVGEQRPSAKKRSGDNGQFRLAQGKE